MSSNTVTNMNDSKDSGVATESHPSQKETETATKKEYVFESWPREGKTIGRMIDQGFFLVNPEGDTDDPPASMYFEPEDLRKFRAEGYRPKIWTVVEAEGKWYIEEGFRWIDRLAYLLEAPMDPDRRAYLLSRRGLSAI